MLRDFLKNLAVVVASIAFAALAVGAILGTVLIFAGFVTWLGGVAGTAAGLVAFVVLAAAAFTYDDRRRARR